MAGQKTSAEQRKERLAKALKANIGRRKEQARTRAAPVEEAGPPPDDESCPN